MKSKKPFIAVCVSLSIVALVSAGVCGYVLYKHYFFDDFFIQFKAESIKLKW